MFIFKMMNNIINKWKVIANISLSQNKTLKDLLTSKQKLLAPAACSYAFIQRGRMEKKAAVENGPMKHREIVTKLWHQSDKEY